MEIWIICQVQNHIFYQKDFHNSEARKNSLKLGWNTIEKKKFRWRHFFKEIKVLTTKKLTSENEIHHDDFFGFFD